MPGPHRIGVDKLLVVWMEQPVVPTIHDSLHAGWIGQAEYTPSSVSRLATVAKICTPPAGASLQRE